MIATMRLLLPYLLFALLIFPVRPIVDDENDIEQPGRGQDDGFSAGSSDATQKTPLVVCQQNLLGCKNTCEI